MQYPDGYIKIKDRSKDIIISGGENISSIEVEDVLYRHPDVLAAAVVAKPDANWGETPCAFVELKAGASATPEEIVAHCRKHLAGFKVPRAVVFGELPQDLHRQDPEVRAPRRSARAQPPRGVAFSTRLSADLRPRPAGGLAFPGGCGHIPVNEWLTLFARRLTQGMGVAGDRRPR